MAVVREVGPVLALVAVLCLPTTVAAVICADDVCAWLADWLADRRSARRIRRDINRLDRVFEANLPCGVDLTEFDRIIGPTIERLAADLRRLRAQRLDLATHSLFWHEAINQAYDDRLRLTSHRLGVEEHLAELDGVDLEIERVRVEGELQAAGLFLADPVARYRAEPR